MSRRVLVTGATGFVGRTLCEELARSGYRVRAALRSPRAMPACVDDLAVVGEFGAATEWDAALDGVDAVVHLAARVHVMNDVPSSRELYMETNVRATEQLAAASLRAGVRNFVFLSSVKVNGEETPAAPFRADDEPHPMDDYAQSKWLAERALEAMASASMSFSVVRPPLVYGPGVRANFLRLMQWVDRGIPLPLGAVRNRRSLVSVWNLCNLVRVLLTRGNEPFRTWMVSDGEDLSTPELIRRIARAMDRRARLLSVPVPVLRTLGRSLGKHAEVHRLCSSLEVDITSTRRELDWTPPVTVDEALQRTVRWFVNKETELAA
jgi:nucleoside-diphosphate-sugar epimerase